MLEAGKKAPNFELPDQDGVMHKLSDYAGKKVILYFYPKDNTPGCTKQACGFSERYPQFAEKGAVILGVSKDSVASHKRFEEKYGLAEESAAFTGCIEKIQKTKNSSRTRSIFFIAYPPTVKNL